jgi:SMODS-associating 2TM, beta-strand rich effector domain
MHAYTADAPDRRIAPIVIGALAIFLALGLSKLLAIADISPPWWIDTPSVLGFYWPLWRIYDRWGWKWRLGPLTLSTIRDFSGSWHGVVTSSYDSTADVQATLTIVQRWLSILITLETQWSRSHSTMAQVSGEGSQEPGLRYLFRNQPRPLSAPTMVAHHGIAHLRLSEDGDELIGDYEAAMQRNTAGRMHFVRAP